MTHDRRGGATVFHIVQVQRARIFPNNFTWLWFPLFACSWCAPARPAKIEVSFLLFFLFCPLYISLIASGAEVASTEFRTELERERVHLYPSLFSARWARFNPFKPVSAAAAAHLLLSVSLSLRLDRLRLCDSLPPLYSIPRSTALTLLASAVARRRRNLYTHGVFDVWSGYRVRSDKHWRPIRTE